MDLRGYKIFMFLMAMGIEGCLVSCVSNSEDELFPDTENVAETAVTFSPNVTDAQDTRATYPTNGTGSMTTDKLKDMAFGVFSFYSKETKFFEKANDEAFNFMHNQKVAWNSLNSYWTYEPLKYWPNDNNPADNQGAMGSQTHNYLSFFAYAPYTENTDAATDTDDGIVSISTNDTKSGETYLTYRTSAEYPFIVDKNVDLLWACRLDLWKTMESGEGYVDGQVKFNFKHALSKFTITVQGLFDHVDNSDQSTDYPDDVDANTRILIESVDFGSSPLMKEGDMYIVPQADGITLPYWKLKAENKMGKEGLTIKDFAINSNISDAYANNGTFYYHDGETLKGSDATETKELFDALPTGVTHEEVSLFARSENEEDDLYYLVIPNNHYIQEKENDTENGNDPMQIHIVYYVLTYDANLKLNKIPYCSIVKNDITATFSNDFVFEPNKQYKLRLMLGLTTAKFAIEVAEGWEKPIKVADWYIESEKDDSKQLDD